MMKKMIALITAALMAATLAACGSTDSGSSTSAPSADTSEQENGGSDNQSFTDNNEGDLQESQDGTAGETSDTAVTEFTVEIYPAIDSVQPVDDPHLTFTLQHIPDEWMLEEQDIGDRPSYSFNYYQDGRLAATIQGGREVSDLDNPFADVWEEFDTTVSINEIDISTCPVMLHILFLDYLEPQSYAYCYYVDTGGRLVEIEFWAPDNAPGAREQFDAIVASFDMA